MPAYKDSKTNTWRVIYRTTDYWTGKTKQVQKRGFRTKKEALEWECEQLSKSKPDPTMTFESFVELYKADMKVRIKESTWCTKENIIRKKLLPYFKKRKILADRSVNFIDIIAFCLLFSNLSYRDLHTYNGYPSVKGSA